MDFANDPEILPQLKYVHKLIKSHIGAKEFENSLEPRWLRGLSDLQLNAVHALSSNLCYDILESTTYRVQNLLSRMGIEPRPPRQQLQKVFTISRGNDVAFLWFLMEMFYKSSGPKDIYNINEQIIMSAIFWLDIVPTLRELDRLLPLPHKSAEVRAKLLKSESERIRRAERRQQLEYRKLMKKSQSPTISPYFAKPCPFRPQKRRLIADYPPVQIQSIKLPDDPKPNASLQTRWFGDFVFDEGKRVATTLVHKEIDNVLTSLKAAKVSQNHVESMCVHHQQIKKMEQSLKMKMEMFKQKERERLVQVGRRHKAQREQRLLDELDRLTEQYQAKFHAMAVKARIDSTRKRLSADLNEPDFYYLCEDVDPTDSTSDLELNEIEAHAFLIENPPPACRDNTPRQAGGQDAANEAQVFKQRQSSLMQFLLLGGMKTEQKKSENCTGTVQANAPTASSNPPPCPCSSTNGKYLEFSKYDYKFNYHNLFGSSRKRLRDDKQLRLKAKFIKALDDDVEYIHRLLDGDQGALEDCVDRTVSKMFKEGIDRVAEEYKQAEATPSTLRNESRMDFGLEYYDADNLDQMKNMLRVCLERVAEDRRYVLPTLPNVHLVPLLIEWIRARYGKQYSQAESARICDQAMHLMNHLTVILHNKILRRSYNVKLSEKVSISKIIKMQQQTNSRVLNLFGSSILEVGRVFQSIMQNSCHTKATSTYFAYMPAHRRDVDLHRNLTYMDRRRRKTLSKL